MTEHSGTGEPPHDEDTPRPDAQDPTPEGPAEEPESAESSEGAEPQAPESNEPPTLTELLTGAARGDQPSFSAFFDATSDVVYGMALLMHADYDDAHSSTVAVYRNLWDQADARARDLRLQTQTSQLLTDEHSGFSNPEDLPESTTYRPTEYELVLEWLVPLAHRIFVERFREGVTTPIPLTPVPQSEGGGVAGMPEEVLDDMLALSDSQAQALAMTYLGGMTHQQVAETVGAAVPSIKSRLRDAMARLHSQRQARDAQTNDPILRAAVTKEDVARGSGVNRNFSNEIAADLDKGLLVELAELYALDALDDTERALLDEKALTADAHQAQQWDTRVLAARRTLSEVFASDTIAPPPQLLDEVLQSVGDQEVGVGLVEDISTHTGESERRTPVVKRWMFIAGFILVLIIGIVVIWQVTTPQNVRAIAEADEDAHVVEGYEMAEGGQLDAVLSSAEDVGFVDFEDVPELPDGDTYQVWLMPQGASEPSSLGNFTAEELEENGVEIPRMAQYRSLLITVEPIRNQERPEGESVAQLDLHSRN
ncbi:hypothetical protein HGQ17_12850 [Nesterenkonia sp. MY13]|uniref:Regulator of SigK n=1 Tax=Nesterenkonia sedimenti TaxID=1463632 RepID=A0A7X8TL92_9MICC|nr:anti-sigma factor [Nesterenkonia sedimenti]NLS10865.1 hypothetical protein [Nesterenkonia sedimenti]